MSHWIRMHDEPDGFSPNKFWVTDGKERALFKPDTEDKESEIEYETYKIAKALGISCAKTEVAELFGETGTLSYNFKTDPHLTYSHG